MINNDYIRGYFDAHGLIYFDTNGGRQGSWRILFTERLLDQLQRVVDFLREKDYTVRVYPHKRQQIDRGIPNWQACINRQADVKHFAEEIGTERPEWQERFAQVIG